MKLFYTWLTLLSLLVSQSLVLGHGFGGETMVRVYDHQHHRRPKHWSQTPECWQHLQQLYENPGECSKFVAKTYDVESHNWQFQPITKFGKGRTNCYLQIQFGDSHFNLVKCTPSQEFNVITHNLILESGSMALVSQGASYGSLLGPYGTLAGAAIGGLVVLGAVSWFGGWDRIAYQAKYDLQQVRNLFRQMCNLGDSKTAEQCDTNGKAQPVPDVGPCLPELKELQLSDICNQQPLNETLTCGSSKLPQPKITEVKSCEVGPSNSDSQAKWSCNHGKTQLSSAIDSVTETDKSIETASEIKLVKEILKTAVLDKEKECKIYIKNGGIIALEQDFKIFPIIRLEVKETIKGAYQSGLLNQWMEGYIQT